MIGAFLASTIAIPMSHGIVIESRAAVLHLQEMTITRWLAVQYGGHPRQRRFYAIKAIIQILRERTVL